MKIEPFVGEQLASLVGAAIAAARYHGGWSVRILYLAGGWGLANVVGEPIAGITGLGINLAYCLVALFGLVIIESIFDMIRSVDVKRIGSELTRAIVRLIKR